MENVISKAENICWWIDYYKKRIEMFHNGCSGFSLEYYQSELSYWENELNIINNG